MKQIAPNYTYNKTTGVITLTGVDIDRDQLLLIVNTTRNVTYYNFADSATTLQAFTKGASTSFTLNSAVITASSTHANTDALVVYYDDQSDGLTVTANVGDPNNVIQSGVEAGLQAYAADSANDPLPISGTVTANVGDSLFFNYSKGMSDDGGPKPELGIQIGYTDNADDGFRIVSDTAPLPISGTVTANAGGDFANSIENVNDVGNVGKKIAVQLYDDNGGAVGVPNNPLPISGTVTANVFGKDANSSATPQIPVIAYDEGIGAANSGYVVPVQVTNVGGQISEANPLPISGTVNANLAIENDFVTIGEEIAQGIINKGTIPISGTATLSEFVSVESSEERLIGTTGGNGLNAGIGISFNLGGMSSIVGTGNPFPISGTVTANAGGETPTSGTATLTNDTRWELNTEGFGHIAFEIVSSGVTWQATGVAAQAYNGTVPANGNVDIFAPAGIRYRHSSDTSVAPTTALNNIYFNLGIGPSVGNSYGTNLIRVDGSNSGSLALPTTGTRYFLFDLTTSRFALRPFFTAGTLTVKYRLYKEKHPFFSARNIIATGDGTGGAVRVVPVSTSNVYVEGGYLDNEVTAYVNGGTVTATVQDLTNCVEAFDEGIPQSVVAVHLKDLSGAVLGTSGTPLPVTAQGASGQGTVSSFTSTISAVLRLQNSTRKLLTVFNEGAGNLFVLLGGGTASTTNYSLRLSAGDFYELDKYTGEVNAIFGSAGTARVTEIT